jgi:hypothetical protein
VVSGVDDLAPGVVEGAVELRSIRQSLLCWALGKGCPAKLATATLEPPSDGEPIFSIWSERSFDLGNTVLEKLGMPAGFDRVTEPLKLCEPSDRVFGELVSMIRYPMKINWYSDAAPTLHDLSWDPWERSDLMGKELEVEPRLAEELESFVAARVRDRDTSAVRELSDEAAYKLKSLGYAE